MYFQMNNNNSETEADKNENTTAALAYTRANSYQWLLLQAPLLSTAVNLSLVAPS